jgi:GT2 family glycosyltransferase
MAELGGHRIAVGAEVGAGTHIDQAGRLADDIVVILGSGPPPEVSVSADGRAASIESLQNGQAPFRLDGDQTPDWVTVALDPNGVSESLTDLKTLVRSRLSALDPSTRTSLVTFLASAAQRSPKGPSPELSRKLFGIRQALRERFPLHVSLIGKRRALVVDQILRVDEHSFYAQGWFRDEEADVTRLTAVSPEGSRAELYGNVFRYLRPDVATFFAEEGWPGQKDGFVCYFELDAPSVLRDGWLLEMENADGVALEVQVPTLIEDPVIVRELLLAQTVRERVPSDELMANHILPAMSRVQARVENRARIENVLTFGTIPTSPDVTIVVALYQQLDHVEAQLAAFADDPMMQETELIYVLDSPEQTQVLENLAPFLFPIYRVPFRIAVLAQNVGFAEANNAGASIARGRLLLLLNSDVLPDRPGWIETMRDFYDSKPDIGALGPKLLYEDETIQHAGMYLQQPPNSPMWYDAHYCKGLHRTFEDANVARPVPAVSGACMMIDRTLYEGRGGLSGRYVRGDWEDFDLCMQLMQMGKRNWYIPDAELYHLEGQSYAPTVRMAANTYNTWLHTHSWKDAILELAERKEFQPFDR